MKIEKQILDKDGSAREINIDNINASKACGLIEHFLGKYSLLSATVSDGRDVLSVLMDSSLRSTIFEEENNYVDSFWKNPKELIRELQLFFQWGKCGDIYVELTFNPDDVDTGGFNMDRFMDFLKPIIKISGTEQLYVRYESISWEYGDISKNSGVIFHNLEAGKIFEK